MKDLGTLMGTDDVEIRYISQLAQAHGGKNIYGNKDKIGELPEKTPILGFPVRVQLLAALLKFADELSDDSSRAAEYLLKRDQIPKSSEVYHHYSRTLHSVGVNHDAKVIELHFSLDKESVLKKYGKNQEQKYLLDEIYERTLKTYCECIYCMRFVPSEFQIRSVKVIIEFFDKLTEIDSDESWRAFSDPIKYTLIEKEIVDKRLAKANIHVNAEDFFPVNEEQEERKRKIYERIKEEHSVKGRGSRPTDDAYRYATSEYIKELSAGRSAHTYCYAGFKELVHISSGIIRLFLEPAAIMYSEMVARNNSGDRAVDHIDPKIQHEVIWEYSIQFMSQEFDKLEKDEKRVKIEGAKPILSKTEKLRNLVLGMGGLFHKILKSEASERRVFSIALNDTPDEELSEILNLGVQNGYLYESSISNKTRTGRSKLYILSRRLAPYFILDPSSFAGYKHMNSATLKIALKNHEHFIREVLKENPPQGTLFTEEELS